MDGPRMVSFPLPLVSALLCAIVAGLFWRLELGVRRANVMFVALLVLCAVESILVGMRFGYGIGGLIAVQRVLPLYFGPVMYLGFLALTLSADEFRRAAGLHLAAPIAVLAVQWLLIRDPDHRDWLISASYLFYLVALYRLWRRGPDALSYAHIELTRRLSNWVLRAVGLLFFVLLLDTVIAVDFLLNGGVNAPVLIAYGTAPLIVLMLVVLVTVPSMLAAPSPARDALPKVSDDADIGIEARLRELMHKERLYLDPDVTVQRLAKRLHLPARTLSAAINRVTAANLSQYVNDFRLAHAAALLAQSDDSVTRIAAQSGFLSRSNFYREFQRVHGLSPVEYRKSGKPSAQQGQRK